MERGSLVHAALAAFWRDVGDHATLVALAPDVLAKRIAGAVDAAIATLPPGRWRELLAVVADGEAKRLASLVEAWLDAQERPRPPFAVLEVESSLPLAAAGISLRLRLDRVDSLGGGGVAIVDYKTGRVSGPDAWLDARPQAPQLGLYALARRAAVPTEPVRAVAYAQVRPGEMKVQGLAAEADVWPTLGVPAELKRNALPGWAAVEARWAETLGALAAEVAAGLATVTPRDTHTTCGRCRLQALCRIGALALEDREGDGDE
jgi:exodeoxyribonuclease-5